MQEEVDPLSSDSDGGGEGPRHLTVWASQIYKDCAGPLLDEPHRLGRQTLIIPGLMAVQDGYSLMTQAPHKSLNYKLFLRAAPN